MTGQSLQGERNGRALLEESDIPVILSLWFDHHMLQRDIAAKFNVAQRTISAVVCRKTWRHVVK